MSRLSAAAEPRERAGRAGSPQQRGRRQEKQGRRRDVAHRLDAVREDDRVDSSEGCRGQRNSRSRDE